MREIPSLFFSDDFCLESYDTYVEATASGKEEGKKREEVMSIFRKRLTVSTSYSALSPWTRFQREENCVELLKTRLLI